jgi:phosphohistidine phosphatase SixA
MRLDNPKKLSKLWRHAFDNGANIILMRHAPKSGSDGSNLSDEGKKLASQYGNILRSLPLVRGSKPLILYCTTKRRTEETLELIFSTRFFHTVLTPLHYPSLLRVNEVSPFA